MRYAASRDESEGIRTAPEHASEAPVRHVALAVLETPRGEIPRREVSRVEAVAPTEGYGVFVRRI